ncbi:MAG: aminopeptidase P family protein [Chloroflexi bacterium]|nr:aminopeptidase P family protein [Chloroflexota bacterium]
MAISPQALEDARMYMGRAGLGGWLLFDYQRMNPVLWQLVGDVRHVTRPCFLLVAARGDATLLVHHVDLGRFHGTGLTARVYRSRAELVEQLRGLLASVRGPVAMEYSPLGQLPRSSRVDAGTVELVRSLGVEVVSSADLFQYVTQRWTQEQLASHRRAAENLGAIVHEAFDFIGYNVSSGVTELQVARFIRQRYEDSGLATDDGPVVAVNEHSGDPHYEPPEQGGATIRPGDWVLLDLWAREQSDAGTFADITWVGYVGNEVPERHAQVFALVAEARDTALRFVEEAFRMGWTVEGWQVDRAARNLVQQAGYGPYFTHRLGHSLGRTVHADAVNLDDFETHDTRKLIPGIGFTIEPGIYLPEFGVRSEIDVYLSETGPVVTTEVQREVVRVQPRRGSQRLSWSGSNPSR